MHCSQIEILKQFTHIMISIKYVASGCVCQCHAKRQLYTGPLEQNQWVNFRRSALTNLPDSLENKDVSGNRVWVLISQLRTRFFLFTEMEEETQIRRRKCDRLNSSQNTGVMLFWIMKASLVGAE